MTTTLAIIIDAALASGLVGLLLLLMARMARVATTHDRAAAPALAIRPRAERARDGVTAIAAKSTVREGDRVTGSRSSRPRS